MSKYINMNLPIQMDFLIDTLKSLDQKSKQEIYLKVFVEPDYKTIDQYSGIDIKRAYDEIFSDESICQEQLETAQLFENIGNDEGQEW